MCAPDSGTEESKLIMGDLLQLNRREPWPELAEKLRELADRAEAGDLMAYAFVLEDHRGAMAHHAFHGVGSYPTKLIGQLEILKSAIVEKCGPNTKDDT